MLKPTPQIDPRITVVREWGYSNAVMFTQPQIENLLRVLDGYVADAPNLLKPKGKYHGQPEHAQRGWQPK